MKNSIKKFLLLTLMATLPLIILVALYSYLDPFHVVHPITKNAAGCDSVISGNNAGFRAVETYLTHNKDLHFDSFIFGSSMSQNYKANYWKPYIDENASILHFDASGETLEGIINKMNFLNNHGSTIKNALIIIEVEMLGRPTHENDIRYAQHPATTGFIDWFHFHTMYFNAFRNMKQAKKAFANIPLEDEVIDPIEAAFRIDSINEVFYPIIDSLIIHDPNKFFTPKRMAKRKHAHLPAPNDPFIDEKVEKQLRTIKSILDKNKSTYIILVPPCNIKPKLKWEDEWLMKSIFGEDKVHNFSDAKEYVGNEYFYYDEPSHLISAKCKVLLDSAYKEQATKRLKNPYYKSAPRH